MYHTQIFMDSLGRGPSNLVLDAPSIGLDAPPLWPRRSSLSPRRSWFGFGLSCLGSCLSCEVVLGPLPSPCRTLIMKYTNYSSFSISCTKPTLKPSLETDKYTITGRCVFDFVWPEVLPKRFWGEGIRLHTQVSNWTLLLFVRAGR